MIRISPLSLALLLAACHSAKPTEAPRPLALTDVPFADSGSALGRGFTFDSAPPLKGPPWCRADDSHAWFLVWKLQYNWGSPAEHRLAARGLDLAAPPPEQPGGIRIVRDETVCHMASQVLDIAFFPSPREQAVYVAAINDHYAVMPLSVHEGEFTALTWVTREGRLRAIVTYW